MGLDNTWIYDRTLRGTCSQGSKHVNYIVSTPIGQEIVNYHKILYCPIYFGQLIYTMRWTLQ